VRASAGITHQKRTLLSPLAVASWSWCVGCQHSWSTPSAGVGRARVSCGACAAATLQLRACVALQLRLRLVALALWRARGAAQRAREQAARSTHARVRVRSRVHGSAPRGCPRCARCGPQSRRRACAPCSSKQPNAPAAPAQPRTSRCGAAMPCERRRVTAHLLRVAYQVGRARALQRLVQGRRRAAVHAACSRCAARGRRRQQPALTPPRCQLGAVRSKVKRSRRGACVR
jgi:hypothetical protein